MLIEIIVQLTNVKFGPLFFKVGVLSSLNLDFARSISLFIKFFVV